MFYVIIIITPMLTTCVSHTGTDASMMLPTPFRTSHQHLLNDQGAETLAFNGNKSVNVCYTLKRKTPSVVFIDDAPVSQANAAKYLVVILNRRLTFSKQVTSIKMCVRGAASKPFWLISPRSKLALSNKVTIYKK